MVFWFIRNLKNHLKLFTIAESVYFFPASAACIVQTKILPTELWSWTQGYWEPVGFTGKILCWLQHSGYRAAAWLIIWSTSVKFVHYFSDSLSNLIFLRYPASEFLDLKHSINYLLWPFSKRVVQLVWQTIPWRNYKHTELLYSAESGMPRKES